MKVLITWSIILLDCFFDLTLEPTCDFVHYFFFYFPSLCQIISFFLEEETHILGQHQVPLSSDLWE